MKSKLLSNLTAITFGYNCGIATEHLIKSFLRLGYNLNEINFVIADNSTKSIYDYELSKKYNIKYIDNRDNKLHFSTDNTETWGSTSHSKLIQYCIDHVVNTKYLLIMDCDIAIKKRFDIWLEALEITNNIICGCPHKEGTWNVRIHPCFTLLNVNKLKLTKQQYFGILQFGKYDTGCELYEKNKNDVLYMDSNIVNTTEFENEWFIHYGELTHNVNKFNTIKKLLYK